MKGEKTKPQAGGPGASGSVTTLADGQTQDTAKHEETEVHATTIPGGPVPSLEQARAFLALIDPDRERWRFRTVFERGRRGKTREYYDTFDEVAEQLVADNLAGCAVYAVLNEGGTTDASITRITALFSDFDGSPMPDKFDLEPHVIVETSPGKYHTYWLVDDLEVPRFKPIQQALARKYRSDPSVCNPARLIRVAGFLHKKREPFPSRVIHTSGALPYAASHFQFATPVSTGCEHEDQPTARSDVEVIRDALGHISPDDYGTWIAVGHCLRGLGDEGHALWLEWSRKSPKWQPTDAEKWDTFKGDRAGVGGIFAKARKAGWRGPPDVEADQGDAQARRGVLAPWPDELLDLPHGLGEVQRWVLGRMMYPSPATAGVTAIALLSAFAMGHITVDSYGGLGLNEQFLILAPTGFGKEELRKPFTEIDYYLRTRMRPSGERFLPHMAYSTPASQQGLHKLLEEHNVQCFLADEFAEWLRHAATDSHKQQALGHIMQTYTKANGVLEAPFAVTNKYEPVVNPRVQIFAMSTAERMLEAMTSSQADSGAINRFVIHVAEQERITKKYDGLIYKPSPSVLDLFDWWLYQPPFFLGLDRVVFELFMERDSALAEPLRFSNNVLAARLSEQAMKMAAIIALSDRRTVVEKADLDWAYKVREGMYHRAAALIGHDGAISGLHATGIAVQQLTKVLKKVPRLYRSALGSRSRKYDSLSVHDQAGVVRTLITNGTAQYGPAGDHVLESRVYGMS